MRAAQIKAFHAVAKYGAFTRAAEVLNTSQPALTVQVRALEKNYGVSLFNRVGRGVSLTSTGKELFQLTARITALEIEAEQYLRAAGQLSTGIVRIAADGPYHIINAVKGIRDGAPDIDIRVSIGNSAAVIRALDAYEAEIGVLGAANTNAPDERFEIIHESVHSLVLVVPFKHAWAKRREVKLSELQDVPMIFREAGSSTRQLFEQTLIEHDVTPRVVLELGSREAVREAVIAGIGLSVVQSAELGQDERLSAIPIEDVDLSTREFIVCRTERRDSPTLSKLVDLVRRSVNS